MNFHLMERQVEDFLSFFHFYKRIEDKSNLFRWRAIERRNANDPNRMLGSTFYWIFISFQLSWNWANETMHTEEQRRKWSNQSFKSISLIFTYPSIDWRVGIAANANICRYFLATSPYVNTHPNPHIDYKPTWWKQIELNYRWKCFFKR